MSIVKSKHASNYTVLPNELFKSGLSLEAIGLLSYFLSLPHDWVIYKTQLHTQLNMGRDKIDRIFKELQNSGYVVSIKQIDRDGRFAYSHIVYDKPYNGEPHTGFSSTEEQPLLSKDIPSTEKQSKENKLALFEKFWDLYDKKLDRKSSLTKFMKLDIETMNKIIEVVPLYVKSTSDKQYRKHPDTWLNGECWNDEIVIPKSIPQIHCHAIQDIPSYGLLDYNLGMKIMPDGRQIPISYHCEWKDYFRFPKLRPRPQTYPLTPRNELQDFIVQQKLSVTKEEIDEVYNLPRK
jgi:hypothetical protein